MDRRKLKNIIILILVLVNVFLITSLAQRRRAERESFERTAEQLTALFRQDGMTLDPRAISRDRPPDGVALTRDTLQEERAAAFLLGKAPASSDQGGGIFHYAGQAGEAFFRSNGGFEASGVLAEDPEDFCRDFCREFSYEAPVFQLDENGDGSAVVSALYGGLPVFNCTALFTVEGGVLTAVSGTLLSRGGPSGGAEPPLSAAGALLAFQRMRRESAAVVSTVTDARLCYELQTGGGVLSLAPVWRIVTDTEDYYVNCYTGAVSAGGGVSSPSGGRGVSPGGGRGSP
ncbi:hypothetical protein AALC17_18370 [Oscillospiraceae bacterium 38-13]